jgi:hypothetical protein
MRRTAFIADIGSHYTADQLIFIDESAKDERTLSRNYGYSLRNAHAVKKAVFVRGTRYTILPALSLDGIIGLDIMEGSCDKQKFKEFIMNQVVSIVNDIFIVVNRSLTCCFYYHNRFHKCAHIQRSIVLLC